MTKTPEIEYPKYLRATRRKDSIIIRHINKYYKYYGQYEIIGKMPARLRNYEGSLAIYTDEIISKKVVWHFTPNPGDLKKETWKLEDIDITKLTTTEQREIVIGTLRPNRR